ncbi:uncharacterized protein LOC135809374 isoform X2 [Sycon ciliatum]|uniref:uncharacterized protein LOC135809374 isoform X2 n=1 Tax=Sycon ciliatum TaxID=27933 RepID=UPI0020AB1B52
MLHMGCGKTYNAAQTWSFRLLNAGLNCGCGPICSVAGYHLFSICLDTIHGGSLQWGRRRRDIESGPAANFDDMLSELMSNSSVPRTVTTEELYEELRAAQSRLIELKLATHPHPNSTQAINADGPLSASARLRRIVTNKRRRRDAASITSCFINWDDIPMNLACCLSSAGCSALGMREYC